MKSASVGSLLNSGVMTQNCDGDREEPSVTWYTENIAMASEWSMSSDKNILSIKGRLHTVYSYFTHF